MSAVRAQGVDLRRARAATIGVAVSLGALVALVALPFAWSHFAWRDLADAHIHLIRIYVIDAALARGDLYPRWLPDLYLGYGYPLLNYYAPATYYVGSLFHRLGATVYGSLQLLGVLAVGAGAVGAYRLAAAEAGGGRLPALLAAAGYVLAPYPFLTNLYVRAALPEALALGLLPWLFLAARRAAAARGRYAPLALAAAVAALLLTHNVSALIALPLLFLWLVLRRGTSLRRVGPPIALGVGLAAFLWLPALAEAGHVQLDLLRGEIYEFGTWLFDPLRALASPDYPHTRFGPADLSLTYDYSALDKAVPPKLALPQLLLVLMALAGAIAGAARRLPAAARGGSWLALAGICLFLNTTWSQPLWERLPLLPMIQFPWRLYGPASLAIALAAATAPAQLRAQRLPGGAAWPVWAVWTAWVAALALVGLLAVGSLARRPLLLAPDPPHDVDARLLASEEYNKYGAGTTSGGEFLPRTVGWPADGATRRGIRLYEEAYPQAGWQAGLVRVLEGRAALPEVWRDVHGIAATVEAETPARVGIHQLAFPGWRGYLDEQPVTLGLGRYEPLDASLGFMTLEVPPGRHQLEVRFGPTPARHAGNAMTAAAVGVLLALSLRRPAAALALAPLAALLVVGLGELGARPMATQRPETSVVAADVVTAVASSRAQTRAPAGSGAGPLPPFLEPQFKRINDEERPWLYMHPPSAATVQLRVPSDAYFQAGLALDPAAWSAETGDGVRFILEAETAAGRTVLLDRRLNPRASGEERTWNDVWVPLGSLAGQDVRLTLRTEPVADLSYDWAGWSSPQVVVYRAARPHPGTPHKW